MNLHIPNKLFLYFTLIIVASSGFFFTVFLPSPNGFYAFIVVAALAGLAVCFNIYDTKSRGKHLVCPTGSDCDAVIKSRYSKFFGIGLEYWGMAYFGVIILIYLMLIFFPGLFGSVSLMFLVLFSTGAGFFSLYLLFVQAFLLRQWCIWCILTALLSLTIFVSSFISVSFATDFLIRIDNIIEMIKFLGFSLGLGSVTAAVFLFIHFLHDETDEGIDERELDAIKSLSELSWFGLGLVLVSQFALLVANPDTLSNSSTSIALVISIFVSGLLGAVLMIVYAPFLTYVPFEPPTKGKKKSSFATLRQPTMVLGSAVVSSWYFAFVMNFLPDFSVYNLLVTYAITISLGALITIVWEMHIRTRHDHSS